MEGSRTLEVIERIIRGSSRERPADGVLRQQLKSEHRLPPEKAREICRAVFAYYRWRGWLAPAIELQEAISTALQLARRFEKCPGDFSTSDLLARAVPHWLSEQMELSEAFLRALQREPRLWLRARPGQGNSLARRLGNSRSFGAEPLGDAVEYLGREDLFRTPEFHRGEFEIQDLSSQAVGLMCDPGPGQKWWDACAGEGGKTLHLSALMENKGLIWATDPAAWRLERLRRRAARAGVFNFRTVQWDGGPRLPTRTKFDGVLVDAPCSGIGTWQRNPHARWTLEAADVQELAALQEKLLTNASAAVKPGGKLLYAVCTMTRAETTERARRFSDAQSDFKPLPIVNPLDPSAGKLAEWQLWPEQNGGNGMFVAAWERREGAA